MNVGVVQALLQLVPGAVGAAKARDVYYIDLPQGRREASAEEVVLALETANQVQKEVNKTRAKAMLIATDSDGLYRKALIAAVAEVSGIDAAELEAKVLQNIDAKG